MKFIRFVFNLLLKITERFPSRKVIKDSPINNVVPGANVVQICKNIELPVTKITELLKKK